MPRKGERCPDELRERIAATLRQDPVKRFWSKVEKTEDCWLWRGTVYSRGYGAFGLDGKNLRAHRYSWELVNGPIPGGMRVCHRCDVPLCVRPDHLFLGTDLDNVMDKYAKGRGIAGDKSPRAKVSNETVIEIKRLLSTGLGGTEIQSLTGVPRDTVYNIKRGSSWKRVA